MSSPMKIKGLPEFTATLQAYARISHRDAATICNTKAFYIARRACKLTYRPEPTKIGRALSEMIYDFSATGKRSLKTRAVYGSMGQQKEAPIAALLINWKRGKLGKKGLEGDAMARAIKSFVAVRNRARAFLASGWIPAIKRLAALAERKGKAVAQDRDAARIRNPRGRVIPAVQGPRTAAKIISEATSRHTTTADPLDKYGRIALEKAIRDETITTLQYIEQKLRDSAKGLGIKTRG
jgi:hypothetical protein